MSGTENASSEKDEKRTIKMTDFRGRERRDPLYPKVA
jgi:hypothetical protein